jgi:8-hydroxy-5-deazaflavin:NADPH oxidoreductase
VTAPGRTVAVIGAGPVGRALARRWQEAGFIVTVAVRDPREPRYEPHRRAHRLVALEAVPPADATVLAVPGDGLGDLLDQHAPPLDGRLIVDATNRVGTGPMHQLPLLAARLPSARVYRAFTSVGWENFTDSVAGQRPDLLYSGPDGTDRRLVCDLVAATGMRPVWLGDGPAAADILDGAARLWFALALGRGLGRNLAFRFLTDKDLS